MSGSEKPDFNDALAVGRALDLTLPDSHAVREAYAQAKAESSPWLFNHVARRGSLAQSWHSVVRSIRMPSWLPSRCFCTISALLAVALRIVASRSSERTPAASSPLRMTWGSVEQR